MAVSADEKISMLNERIESDTQKTSSEMNRNVQSIPDAKNSDQAASYRSDVTKNESESVPNGQSNSGKIIHNKIKVEYTRDTVFQQCREFLNDLAGTSEGQSSMSISIQIAFRKTVLFERPYWSILMKNLPHSIKADFTAWRICLVVPELENFSYQQTINHFNKLHSKSVFEVHVTTFGYLNLESADKELLTRSNIFVVDQTLSHLVEECHFFQKKPNKATITFLDLFNPEVLSCLINSTSLGISKSSCSTLYSIGHSKMSPEQLSENVVESLDQVKSQLGSYWGVIETMRVLLTEQMGKSVTIFGLLTTKERKERKRLRWEAQANDNAKKGKVSKKKCFLYRNPGSCSRGDKCPFRHV